MAREVEAKFSVADFRAVRRALRAAGARYLGTVVELDRFFDLPDRRLYQSGCGLRLRHVRVVRHVDGGRGGGWLLTAKGPKRKKSRLKIRREVQTSVADGQAMVNILKAAGLEPVVAFQKRRTSYRVDQCAVELDEVSGLGRFVEIEGPGARAIEAVRKKLPLPDEPISASYLEMLAERKAGKLRR